MLDSMRRGAQGVVAKVLFSVLVASFVLWGVPRDFLASSDASIATVGKTGISLDRFRRAFENQVVAMSNDQTGRISRETAIALGVDRNVAERLVGQTALLEQTQKMNLAISDETLAEGVRNDPMFHGLDGKFSKLGYDGFLQQLGLSEQGFFALRREDELRRQLTDGLTVATVVPSAMIDVRHAFNEEIRTTAHFVIDAVKKVVVEDPTDTKLIVTYENNKTQFMTPEYRKIAVLLLTLDELKKDIQVSDAEVKASYDDSKATYDKPERRRIQQISFKDKAAAEAARKAIVDGKKNFIDAAKEAGAKETDINLGMLTQKQLIDPAVAKAAFALARDEVSQPVDGKFTTLILRVIEIDPGKMTVFEDVKDLVRDKLVTKKAEGLVQEKIDLVEEARNAGKTLKEAGESLKLVFKDAEAVTSDNKTPDGKTALDITDAPTVLNAAFAATPGAQTDIVKLQSGSYAWFDTLGITPPRQKTFEEAKALVKDYYAGTEQKKKLNEMAAKMAERLKNGEYINKLAEEAGGKVEITENVKRVMSVPGMSQDAVKLAFTLPKNGTGHSESADEKSRVVFKVINITIPPPPTKEEAAKLAGKLKDELETDALIAFVEGLKSRFGVSMNEPLLKRFSGASDQP
ncbi:MAG: SurA N-terminal domain-containing protein [Hyphomicrobium sp.]